MSAEHIVRLTNLPRITVEHLAAIGDEPGFLATLRWEEPLSLEAAADQVRSFCKGLFPTMSSRHVVQWYGITGARGFREYTSCEVLLKTESGRVQGGMPLRERSKRD